MRGKFFFVLMLLLSFNLENSITDGAKNEKSGHKTLHKNHTKRPSITKKTKTTKTTTIPPLFGRQFPVPSNPFLPLPLIVATPKNEGLANNEIFTTTISSTFAFSSASSSSAPSTTPNTTPSTTPNTTPSTTPNTTPSTIPNTIPSIILSTAYSVPPSSSPTNDATPKLPFISLIESLYIKNIYMGQQNSGDEIMESDETQLQNQQAQIRQIFLALQQQIQDAFDKAEKDLKPYKDEFRLLPKLNELELETLPCLPTISTTVPTSPAFRDILYQFKSWFKYMVGL